VRSPSSFSPPRVTLVLSTRRIYKVLQRRDNATHREGVCARSPSSFSPPSDFANRDKDFFFLIFKTRDETCGSRRNHKGTPGQLPTLRQDVYFLFFRSWHPTNSGEAITRQHVRQENPFVFTAKARYFVYKQVKFLYICVS
jgi:hypothetical protein